MKRESRVCNDNSLNIAEGRKGSSLLVIKSTARTVVGRGEKSLPSDPESELHLGRKETTATTRASKTLGYDGGATRNQPKTERGV